VNGRKSRLPSSRFNGDPADDQSSVSGRGSSARKAAAPDPVNPMARFERLLVSLTHFRSRPWNCHAANAETSC
jgi:hypothetical protein